MPHRPLARLAGLAGCLMALAFVPSLAAQAGSSVDVITGTVTDSSGVPVAGATVEAYSIETQVNRRTTTNDKGRYTIFFNDGGGQYRLTVTMIGKQPFVANITRQSDDDRIMVDVRMSSRPVVLQDIVSTARRTPAGMGREAPTPGSTERAFSGDQALRLPIDASDLTALAALVPGVIVTAGNDSTAAQFSIAGQSGTANNYTVDGLSFAGDALPQDAIRGTRVISNTYDVARGQFSGGLISASTRGGSNVIQGSVSGNLRDDAFSLGGTSGDVFNQGQSQQRLGFGFGGPIVRDRFFAFGSLQVDASQAPIASLSAATAASSGRLGLSADSVARFTSLVDATGLTSSAGIIDPTRGNDRYTGLLRLDWNLADRHTFTFRGDLRLNHQEPNRIGTTSLAQVGGTTEGNGGGVSVGVFSRLGVSVTNEFRAGYTSDKTTSTPFLYAPSGRVQNVSDLGDGTFASSVLGFGGNSGLPQETTNRGIELTEEVSFFSPTAAHRYRLGLLFNTQDFSQDVTTNRFGTYTYNSLEDFAANTPAQFTRTLSPTIRDGRSNNTAIYLSDVWRPSSNLQLTLGGRLEHSWFGGAPARNDAAAEAFGIATDVLPTETYFTPRLGFSYSIAAAEQRGQSQRGFAPPTLTIRGGVGLFRGTMPSTIPGTAQAQSGLLNTESQLICVGDAVPLPDWSAIGGSTDAIPTACDGPATPANRGVPNITTYASDYGAAKTWRASLGLSKRFWNTWSLNLDGSYVRGIDQSASRDLNLNATPMFTLGGGDGRPVYADPAQIIASTGAVPLSASRVNPAFGRVNEVFSGLENTTTQLTASVSTFLRRGATVNFSYTWQRSRDQGGSGGGGGGFGGGRGGVGGGFSAGGSIATPGDPNSFLWADASRTHNIQANISWPFSQALDVSLVGRMTSGSRYTPIVQGDINGDGASRNDIAFVYDPASAPTPEVAAAMDRLLGSLSGNARECLASQLGGIAERNSCVGPWQPSLDLQVNWRPGMFDNRLALSFSTINLLGGLDELFHGQDGLKGWGLNQRPDATLLQVTGFDATTREFQYVVNERFGATGGSANAIRSPFQVALQMRYSIGQDRGRDIRRNFFQGQGGQPSLVQQMLGRLDSISPNPAKEALARRDSLALDARQVEALQLLVDSSAARLKPALDSLNAEIARGGTNPDIQRIFPLFNEVQRVARLDRDSTTAATRKVLSDAQWALLPEWVRNPTQGNPFFGGGRGGQPGAGGPPGGGRGGFGGGRGGRPDF
ncbi:MAG: carboxypeptidase regulatory-like domain-containing protein [Gemmatimonadales bacterium]